MESLCYLYDSATHIFKLVGQTDFARRHNIPTVVTGPHYEEWNDIMRASHGIAEVMLDFPEEALT